MPITLGCLARRSLSKSGTASQGTVPFDPQRGEVGSAAIELSTCQTPAVRLHTAGAMRTVGMRGSIFAPCRSFVRHGASSQSWIRSRYFKS